MSSDGPVLGVVCSCHYTSAEMSGDGHCQRAVPATKTRTAGFGCETDPPLPVPPR